MSPTSGTHPEPSFATLGIRNSLQPGVLPCWCLLVLTSATWRNFVFLLNSCTLFVFWLFFLLLSASFLHDLGQTPSPKWLHLLRNDEANLLTHGVYNETSGENYYQEFGTIGEGFLKAQHFPWKRVEMLRLLMQGNRKKHFSVKKLHIINIWNYPHFPVYHCHYCYF